MFQRNGDEEDVDRDKRNRVQNQIMELKMFKVFKYLQSDEESQKDIADSPLQANESITEAKKELAEEQYLSLDQLLEMESNKLE